MFIVYFNTVNQFKNWPICLRLLTEFFPADNFICVFKALIREKKFTLQNKVTTLEGKWGYSFKIRVFSFSKGFFPSRNPLPWKESNKIKIKIKNLIAVFLFLSSSSVFLFLLIPEKFSSTVQEVQFFYKLVQGAVFHCSETARTKWKALCHFCTNFTILEFWQWQAS